MISIGAGPLSKVLLNSHAMKSATIIPNRYIDSMVNAGNPRKPRTALFGIQAAIKTVYTGNRAEQLMSGATRIVTNRSLWLSIVRVAMMPGIAHANELSIGIKLFPCRPTLLISRSIRNAARAM